MLVPLYRTLTEVGAPFLHLYLQRRLKEGREDSARFNERLGIASQPRSSGKLIWCHAASVGEAASLLALVEKLHLVAPLASVLMTTGTVTSARMVEERLSNNVIHQYIPVDRMPYVKKFLDHWRPDLVLWVESELWPNMLANLKQRSVPMVLINGRMSDRSFRHWNLVRGLASNILSSFSLCLVQTNQEKVRYEALGAKKVHTIGNIKYAAKPLPYNESELSRLRKEIGTRPLWLMASTHRGEENFALSSHQSLIKKWPDLLTVIVPRHAVRGDEIARLIKAEGLTVSRRSEHETITASHSIYLADTMNELGLFYRLCPIVAMGASFVALGGHNPIEPAQLGQALIFGPYMHNFSEVADTFQSQGAAITLASHEELAPTIDRLLSDNNACTKLGKAARAVAEAKQTILDRVLDELQPWLALPGFGSP